MGNVKEILKTNIVQITIVLGGVAITIVNAWIAFNLAPIVEDIHSVAQRVSAVEKKQDESISKNEFKLVIDKIDDIKDDVRDIKNVLLSR